MYSLFRVRANRAALSCAIGLSAATKPYETESLKTGYQLNVCALKQDAWDHVALQLVDKTNKEEQSIYKSLCQESHFSPPRDEDSESSSIESDDFSRLLLHWYRNLLRPILIGEPAAFEKDSLPMITQTFSIPLSKQEYQLALAYIEQMDTAVREGKIGYAGLDRTRNFMTDAGRFIGSLGIHPLPETLWADAIDATETRETRAKCAGPSNTLFYNCATYVEGMLDQLGIAKSPKKLQESFCTWPSSIIKRAEKSEKSEKSELASAQPSDPVIDS